MSALRTAFVLACLLAAAPPAIANEVAQWNETTLKITAAAGQSRRGSRR